MRAERIAGQALGMNAHEHVFPVADIALHQRDVVLAVQLVHEAPAHGTRRISWAYSCLPISVHVRSRASCDIPAAP